MRTRQKSIRVDEIETVRGRLMDWIQIMTLVGAGAGATLSILKVMKTLKSSPPSEPVRNGERRSILRELANIQASLVNQDAAIERLDGRVTDINDRLRPIERGFRSSSGPGSSKPNSID